MEILPHFWITYYKENMNIIKIKKIKDIIHLSKKEPYFKKINIEEIKISIDYDENDNYETQNNIMYDNLFDITKYIHDKILNNHNILLIGYYNKQDIDTIITAYLIRYGKLSIQNSILFLKSKKENIFESKCNFYFALNKFYQLLNNIN